MEWYDDRAFHEEAKANTHRVLTVTSGNAQPFTLGSKSLIDRNDTFSFDAPDRPYWQHSVPTTIQLNDRRALLRQKVNARRLKRRIRLAQKYLQHPKFIDFKARPRKDVDKKTGEVIWDEETESAFQNAIINIPAMGRRKKSQHGKTFGRNELIMEWIKQETNKVRTRKQVSSHMQTLDNLFKAKPEEDYSGIPEWRMLNKGTDDLIADSEGPEFYDNSIADMVCNWRMLQVDFSQLDFDFDTLPSEITNGNVDVPEMNALNRLEFEMWVSSPDKTDEAIHKYTCVQSNKCTGKPEPLENIQGWRTSWPGLVPLVEHLPHLEDVDIILLNVSFRLMLDFPPPRSKLGISLELDFNPVGANFISESTKDWSCVTNIYQRGKLDAKVEHHRCPTPGKGRVKPPFESRWWAEQFTRLTEKRRHAMDQGNDAAVAAADEAARNYLNNLKIMQLISWGQDTPKGTGTELSIGATKLERTAVLLWSFSHAAPKFIGTTTWHKLIPPPQRITVNSPLALSNELALPTLNMDATLEHGFEHDSFRPENDLDPHVFGSAADIYRSKHEEELRQDDFMIGSQNNFTSMEIPCNPPLSYHSTNSRYHNHHAYHFNTQRTHEHDPDHYGVHLNGNAQHGLPTNLFEAPHHLQYLQALPIVPSQREVQIPIDNEPESNHGFGRNTLLSFDSTTHKALQAKLHEPQDFVDLAEETATHAAPSTRHPASLPIECQPAASQLPSTGHDEQTQEEGLNADTFRDVDTANNVKQPIRSIEPYQFQNYAPTNETWSSPIIAPVAVRPSLQHHHSFAGMTQVDSTSVLGPVYDIGRTNNYSHLLDSLDAAHDDFPNPDCIFALPDSSDLGHGIARPYSQPPPIASLLEESMGGVDVEIINSSALGNKDTMPEVCAVVDGAEDVLGE